MIVTIQIANNRNRNKKKIQRFGRVQRDLINGQCGDGVGLVEITQVDERRGQTIETKRRYPLGQFI